MELAVLISKRAARGVLRGDTAVIDLIQALEYRVREALGLADIDLLNARVQLRVLDLVFRGQDIQIADSGKLLRAVAVQSKTGFIVRQLDLIGLTGFEVGGDARAVYRAVHRHIAAGDVHELECVGGVLYARQRKGVLARGNAVLRYIIRRFDCADFLACRNLGVKGHAAVNRVGGFRTLGQRLVVIPAEEHHAGLDRGGKLADGRTCRIGFALRHRNRGVRAVITERELHEIRGSRRAARRAVRAVRGGRFGIRFGIRLGLRLLRRIRVHADAVALDARLAVPAVYRFVRAHADNRRLCTGRVALRVEGNAVAVQKSLLPQLGDGVPCVGRDLVKVVRQGGDVLAGVVIYLKRIEIAHQKGRHLLTGHSCVRQEQAVARAARDAVFRRPLHVGRAVRAVFDVAEAAVSRIIGGVNARHASENRHEHAARQRPVGAERCRGDAVKEIVRTGVAHRRIVPVTRLYVGEWHTLGRSALRGRGIRHAVRFSRQCPRRDEAERHAEYQKQADDSFLHELPSSSGEVPWRRTAIYSFILSAFSTEAAQRARNALWDA